MVKRKATQTVLDQALYPGTCRVRIMNPEDWSRLAAMYQLGTERIALCLIRNTRSGGSEYACDDQDILARVIEVQA